MSWLSFTASFSLSTSLSSCKLLRVEGFSTEICEVSGDSISLVTFSLLILSCDVKELKQDLCHRRFKKVQVGKDQEKAQSEKDSCPCF